MSIFISRIKWNNDDYFVGYSTITDRFFTKCYKSSEELISEHSDVFSGLNSVPDNEVKFDFNEVQIKEIGNYIDNMKNQRFMLNDINAKLLDDFFLLLANIFGYFDQGLTKESVTNLTALKSNLKILPEVDNIYEAIDTCLSNSLRDPNANKSEIEFAGIFLGEWFSFLKENNYSVVDLIAKVYNA